MEKAQDRESRINPEVEVDARAHLHEMLQKDEKFRQIWEEERPKRKLATQVLRRRSELEWSQRDLAQEMGTSQNYIHLIENGEANPTIETLQKLAGALGEDLDVTVGLTGSTMSTSSHTEAAAEHFAEAIRESYRAVDDWAVSTQELNAELTQQFFNDVINNLRTQAEAAQDASQDLAEQAQRGQEATKALAQESLNAYTDFLNSTFSFLQSGTEGGERGERRSE